VENEVQGGDLSAPSRPMVYLNNLQLPESSLLAQVFSMAAQYAVRSTLPEDVIEKELRGVVKSDAPGMAEMSLRPMQEGIEESLGQRRLALRLVGGFGVAALVLSAVGIYGVLAYLVSQRTHEIGIRLAMGAERPQVLRMVLGHGLALAMIGLFIGVGAAFFLTSLMAAQLHDIAPRDLTTFVGVPVLMTLVALAASYIPAWRATRVDPLIALRVD